MLWISGPALGSSDVSGVVWRTAGNRYIADHPWLGGGARRCGGPRAVAGFCVAGQRCRMVGSNASTIMAVSARAANAARTGSVAMSLVSEAALAVSYMDWIIR